MSDDQPLLPSIVRLHGRWRAHETAVIASDAAVTWAEFSRRVDQVANGLIAAGCGRGERVVALMSNGVAMLEVILGAMAAGAVIAPLNTSVADDGLDAMLADADASAVFLTADQAGRLSRDLTNACRLRVVASERSAAAPRGWRDYGSWRDAQSAEAPPTDPTRDDLCNIIYSSGTTGQPKGIAHSHGARLDWAHDLAHALRYDSRARTLLATGLYSNITWAGMLPTLLLGGTLVIMSGFNAGNVLEAIARERITNMSMVPVQYQRLLEHPGFEAADRSTLRAMMCCGAPLPASVKAALFETFPCGVIELYGSTEGIITTLPPEEAAGRMASVGRPLPGEDLAIIDDDGRPAPPGASGEVVARSRFAMVGYWNRPVASEEAVWIDDRGRRWLRSGDIGRVDEEGYLFITDRKKDMIISGGQNVYPADIEAVLTSHPDVADCAVFGVPSPRWGETPLALVVLRETARGDAGRLRDWANDRLGKQQRLAAVELRASLPRNANGKLLKRELRAPYWRTSGAGAGA